jgi:probable HAF family extracellular repeat protein
MNQRLNKIIKTLLAVPAVLALPNSLLAAPQYVITDLGTFGGTYSSAIGINEAGQIVGFAYSSGNAAMHPFQWQSSTGNQDLGTLGGTLGMATGINGSGVIVGNSQTTANASIRAFAKTVGGMLTLPGLGGSTSRAIAVNDSGAITGTASLTGDTSEHGAVWPSATATSAIDLRTLGGNNSQGNDVNLAGQVVGYAENVTRVTHAALWSSPYSALPLDLGTLGGTYSEAYAINATGQATGVSTNLGDAQFRGFVWQASTGMVDLGALTPTSTHTAGFDINSSGDVVGYSTTTAGGAKRAIIRKAGAVIADLNGQILPNTGWVLSEAKAINNNGQIVGTGTLTRVDTINNLNRVEQHAYLLTPDTINPTITCPANVTTTGLQPAGLGQATAIDNLDPAPVITNNRPVTFPNGDTVVTWTASDANGNTATCNQLVKIGGDTTPPLISFQLTPVPNAAGWNLTSPSLNWTVTDNESTITNRTGCVNTTAIANTAGQTFSCSATSAGGTSGPVSTTVRVDTTLPTIVGTPANFSVSATSSAGAVVTYTSPTATDTISLISPAGVVCAPASGATLPLGATTINCSASDNAGNVGSSSFVVTVNDTTPPQITFQITPANPSASGWYTSAPNVSWNVVDPESTITSRIGCLAVAAVPDGAANSYACSAISGGGTAGPVNSPTLRVDTVAPTLTGVPVSFTRPATNASGAVVTYTAPIASDVVSGLAVGGLNCLPASGSTFALGNTTVSCSARDVAGNVRNANFTVTVADQTPPVFTSCPASVTITQGQTLPSPTATDNVSVPVLTRSPAGTLALGTTAVTWTATDQAGLTATCNQQVTVNTAVTETFSNLRAQCKVRSATTGQWTVSGTTSVRTNNVIQLYRAASVPADLTSSLLGGRLTVSGTGNWSYQTRSGPACVSAISLRSVFGSVRNNITVSR